MARAFRLFVDESGELESSDPSEVVVVAGLLLPRELADAPIRAAFERAAPYWPWPHHASVLQYGVVHALAARIRGRDPITMSHPLYDDTLEDLIRWGDLLARALERDEVGRDVLPAFDRALLAGKNPSVETAHCLGRRAHKLRPDVSSNLDVYASAVEAEVAESLAEALDSFEGAVALLAEVQCQVPVHQPEHRYLDLLGALHRLARLAASSLGGEVDLDLRISRRSVQEPRGLRPLDVYDSPRILGADRPAGNVRITGFEVEPYRGLDCAAGYVAADFAAIKVRRAFKSPRPPAAEQVAARIRQETGLPMRLGARREVLLERVGVPS